MILIKNKIKGDCGASGFVMQIDVAWTYESGLCG